MSAIFVFDDFSKNAKDIMKDEYSTDNKVTAKINCGKAKVTAESKGTSEMTNKLQVAYEPIKQVNLKKISLDNKGIFVAEIDVPKLLKNTTFTYRGEHDLVNKSSKKAEVGFKVVTPSAATECNFDVNKNCYKATTVYNTKYGLVGLKAVGCLKEEKALKTIDVAYRRECGNYAVALETNEMFKSAFASLYCTPYSNVKVGATATLPLKDTKKPSVEFGVAVKPNQDQEWRAKVTNDGKVTAVWKNSIEDRVTVSATCQLDSKNLTSGKHTVAAAVEFKF
ncbi:hypothetical protein WA158_002469 [Blastocystis sp. Blastoise]